jgi:hypothetical protein
MGFCPCDLCDEDLLGLKIDEEHICNLNKVRIKIKRLQENRNQACADLNKIQDGVFKVLSKYHKELLWGGEEIVIKASYIVDLWNAAGCIHYKATTAEDFLGEWLVTHRVLCEAFDVFEKRPNGMGESQTSQKLQRLLEACEVASKSLNYNTEFDLGPNEVIEKGYKENQESLAR